MVHLAPLLLTLAFVGLPVKTGVSSVEIHGNQYVAKIVTDVTGYEALLVLTFESPDATLDATSLDVSATEVNPAVLQARLPAGVFLPARFPVVVQINQGVDVGTAVTFQNGFTVELVTRHLELRSFSPFRLFKAPDGGAFEDITHSIGFGSFRARGSAGSFSEFVIAADLRPQARIIETKFQNVQTLFDDHNGAGIAGPTYNLLDSQRASAWSAYLVDNLPQAIDDTESMLDTIDAGSGVTIEASYDGGTDESLAGNLFGAVESLRTSLELEDLGDPDQTESVTTHLSTGGGRNLVLRVTFKGRQAIDLDDFNVSAEEVDPTDAALLARLPAGVVIPSEFPVLIHVDPGSNAEQAFRGRASFEVETDDIDFFADSNVRLFKAPDGGAFTDITETYGLGSFRARGSAGSFSELMLVRDLRSNAAVLTAKFLALETRLQLHENDIDAVVYARLSSLLDQAKTAYQSSDLDTAKDRIDAFIDLAEAESGDGVPDIWVSTAGTLRVNVAAALLSAARTVRFNLVIERSPVADPADANRDGVVDELDVFYVLRRVFPGGANPI